MRSLGYTLETAVADLVDNSISHGARNIRIIFDWAGPASTISISDDGSGMNEDELIEAMRPGSHNPRDRRSADDLGRFGLGLKTASFSQATRLTVISHRAEGRQSARVWDLEHVTRVDDWILLEEPTGRATCQAEWSGSKRSGTCVVWESLDRLVGDASPDDEFAHRGFLEAAERVCRHLSMVFGDFLAGSGAVRIDVGNVRLAKWDPFLTKHDATQQLQPEVLPFKGGKVTVQPYVLPHHSKLTPEQFSDASGIHGWNAHQGFYIYRNRRLLVAGGWLGLGLTRDEHLKLARIRIDVGNDVDFEWKLDVRKSRASPPPQLKEALRRIARLTRERAQEVYRHRGRRLVVADPIQGTSVWTASTMRGQTVFRINREHPVVKSLVADGDTGKAVSALLRLVEETIPRATIYIRQAEAPLDEPEPFGGTKDTEFRQMLADLYLGLVGSGRTHAQAIASLGSLAVVGERAQLLELLDANPPKSAEID